MIGRRAVLKGLAATGLFGMAGAVYGLFVEPALEFAVRRWRISPKGWPAGQPLRIAVLSDLHMCDPYVSLERLRGIVARTNALAPDLTVILGDLPASSALITRAIPVAETAAVLAGLEATQGVFAVLGNHDWWDDPVAQARRSGPVAAGLALQANGISVLENKALKLRTGAGAFWLAGLGDQLAFRGRHGAGAGADDLPGTLAQIDDDGPVILLAHEPDIFPEVPARVSLTLSGHTHGGQVRLFGWSPIVPSHFGNRYAYGVVIEEGRHLVVSGGIGFSHIPVRFGMPPEVTLVEIAA